MEKQLADIGEDGGVAHGDAIGSHDGEKLSQSVIDVVAGLEPARKAGEFGGDALGVEELLLLPGVEEAEGRMGVQAEQAALMAASVGEEAAVGRCGSRRVFRAASFRFHAVLMSLKLEPGKALWGTPRFSGNDVIPQGMKSCRSKRCDCKGDRSLKIETM